MSLSRRVSQVVMPPQPVVEGAGVHLGRSIGTRRLDHLDPFLLLDHFESVEPADYRAGFPYHPHRGIETVTFVRKGEVRHRDSLGHQGSIGSGDIQWMTSGSGILHEEMPQVRPEGIAGLQLWLNLPAREKMSRPKYRDLQAAALTEVETGEGARVRVIAGEAAGGGEADRPLNEDQQKVFDELRPRVADGGFSVNLLMGVTGSGKTEVYLQCIREVVRRGKRAIVLVPEIALTPQTVRRFTARFNGVAILHSGLTATERHRYWQMISMGHANVVVGARSAVFAPVPDLGIIVIARPKLRF